MRNLGKEEEIEIEMTWNGTLRYIKVIQLKKLSATILITNDKHLSLYLFNSYGPNNL